MSFSSKLNDLISEEIEKTNRDISHIEFCRIAEDVHNGLSRAAGLAMWRFTAPRHYLTITAAVQGLSEDIETLALEAMDLEGELGDEDDAQQANSIQ